MKVMRVGIVAMPAVAAALVTAPLVTVEKSPSGTFAMT